MSIDELMKNSQTEKRITPTRDLWLDIENNLDNTDKYKRLRNVVLSAAASLTLLMGAFYMYSQQASVSKYSVEDFQTVSAPMYDMEVIKQMVVLRDQASDKIRLNG